MKKILFLLVVIIVVSFSCACGRKNEPEIEFMTWGSKTEIDIIKPIVEEYNKTHNLNDDEDNNIENNNNIKEKDNDVDIKNEIKDDENKE